MKKWIITTVFAIVLVQLCTAQKYHRDFSKVDEYVASLGPMHGHHLKTIVDTLTKRRTAPQADQVRAIYIWEATNIDYNTAGMRHPKNFNPSASEALNTRKTTAEGYANLFKAMCDLARINSVVIHGMAKFDPRNIGELSQKWNKHAWNAVEVDGQWYLVDVAWSAGKTDRKYRTYTKSFTDVWFMTDKEMFALSHFPKDKKWQLLDSPINKSVFTNAPIIGTGALTNEVYPVVAGRRGNIRGKADTTKKMVFEVGNPALIKTVSVTNRTSARIPAPFTISDNLMYVDIPFKSEGDYPFNIYINDQLAYMYKADVSKAKKKPKPKPQAKAKPKPKPRQQQKPQAKQTAESKKTKATGEKTEKKKSKKEKTEKASSKPEENKS